MKTLDLGYFQSRRNPSQEYILSKVEISQKLFRPKGQIKAKS